MPLSPVCLVADGAGPFVPTTGGINITAGDTVSIKLNDTSASTWFLTITGTDELTTAPSLTNVNPTTGQVTSPSTTVTFTFPNAAGRSIVFTSTVVGASTLTTTFALYSLTAHGKRVGSVNETREGSASHGWITILNPIIRQGAAYLYYNDSLQSPPTGSSNIQGALDFLKTNGGVNLSNNGSPITGNPFFTLNLVGITAQDNTGGTATLTTQPGLNFQSDGNPLVGSPFATANILSPLSAVAVSGVATIGVAFSGDVIADPAAPTRELVVGLQKLPFDGTYLSTNTGTGSVLQAVQNTFPGLVVTSSGAPSSFVDADAVWAFANGNSSQTPGLGVPGLLYNVSLNGDSTAMYSIPSLAGRQGDIHRWGFEDLNTSQLIWHTGWLLESGFVIQSLDVSVALSGNTDIAPNKNPIITNTISITNAVPLADVTDILGAAQDSNGNLWVLTTGTTARIIQFDASNSFTPTIVNEYTGTNVPGVQGIIFANGFIWVAVFDQGSAQILIDQYDPGTLAQILSSGLLVTNFTPPYACSGLAFDPVSLRLFVGLNATSDSELIVFHLSGSPYAESTQLPTTTIAALRATPTNISGSTQALVGVLQGPTQDVSIGVFTNLGTTPTLQSRFPQFTEVQGGLAATIVSPLAIGRTHSLAVGPHPPNFFSITTNADKDYALIQDVLVGGEPALVNLPSMTRLVPAGTNTPIFGSNGASQRRFQRTLLSNFQAAPVKIIDTGLTDGGFGSAGADLVLSDHRLFFTGKRAEGPGQLFSMDLAGFHTAKECNGSSVLLGMTNSSAVCGMGVPGDNFQLLMVSSGGMILQRIFETVNSLSGDVIFSQSADLENWSGSRATVMLNTGIFLWTAPNASKVYSYYSGAVNTALTLSGFSPKGICFDDYGSVWVASNGSGGSLVQKFGLQGGTSGFVLVPLNAPLTLDDIGIQDLFFDGKYLWAVSSTGTTYQITQDGVLLNSNFNLGGAASRVCSDGLSLWVTAGHGVTRFSPEGSSADNTNSNDSLTTLLSFGLPGSLFARGIVADTDGTIYIAAYDTSLKIYAYYPPRGGWPEIHERAAVWATNQHSSATTFTVVDAPPMGIPSRAFEIDVTGAAVDGSAHAYYKKSFFVNDTGTAMTLVGAVSDMVTPKLDAGAVAAGWSVSVNGATNLTVTVDQGTTSVAVNWTTKVKETRTFGGVL